MQRTIIPNDIYNLKCIYSPHLSPDSKSILFTITQAVSEDKYQNSIWKASNGVFQPLVTFGDGISEPVWSPNGKEFLYTCVKGGGSAYQIRIADSDGMHNRIVCELSQRIRKPKWSHDGRSIFFLANQQNQEFLHDSDIKVFTKRKYRYDGEGYIHNDRVHLFRIDLIHPSGPKQLTDGEFDVLDFDVYPEDDFVAFLANMREQADFENGVEILKLRTTGGDIVSLSKSIRPIRTLAISPNAKFISFIGHDQGQDSFVNSPLDVWLLDLESGNTSNLTRALDRSASKTIFGDVSKGMFVYPPAWDNSSKRIFFCATDKMSCHLYQVDVDSKQVKQLTFGNEIVDSYSVSADGERIVYTKMDPLHPSELFSLDNIGQPNQEVQRISNFNIELIAQLHLSSPEVFKFNARDGKEIEGWIMRPPSGVPAKNPPAAIVEVHSGGETEGFQFMQEFQCLCAAGFAILTCNFRGTPGYGYDMQKVVIGHFMEENFTDIIDMVDYAIKRSWIDKKKVGITGNSLGGWLTAWAIEHSENKFAAAVALGTCVNMHSYYGTTDDQRSLETDIAVGELPWDNPEKYLNISPIKYVRKISTPLMLIHSENDFRVNIEQAEQLFVALKRLGKEVIFVRVPNEFHYPRSYSKPKHKIDVLKLMLWWFTSHIDSGVKIELEEKEAE